MAKKPVVIETALATYTLGKILGEGGASRVYEAVDEAGSQVAIKVLRQEKMGRSGQKRSRNEIRFGLSNRHENVVCVLDQGKHQFSDGAATFFVMPRYDCSLEVFLQTIPEDRKLCYFDQILSGVQAAHLQDIIHRDLKPANILYNRERDVLVVADFGIARFSDEELYSAAETKPGDRLANFEYAAPEQRLRGTVVDLRADIYALGLILNEVFTSTVPFGTFFRQVRDVSADYAWVDNVVARMISQQREDRPSSIEEVKGLMIGYQQSFITRQRLDDFSRTVVPTTEVTDPLAFTPPTLINFEYDRGNLWLILNQHVPVGWVKALHGLKSYSSLTAYPPAAFRFTENKAYIKVGPDDVQQIVDHFKRWLPSATEGYRQNLERELRQAEAAQRQRFEAERRAREENQRVRDSVRI